MAKYNFNVEKVKSGYSAYLNSSVDYVCTTGSTIDELMVNALEAMYCHTDDIDISLDDFSFNIESIKIKSNNN